jgi:hypothetical protein
MTVDATGLEYWAVAVGAREAHAVVQEFVIHTEGGARNSDPSLFQIACVDSGVIRTVNADAVVAIVQRSGTLQTAHNHSHQHQGSGQGNQQGNRHGGARRIG